MMMVLVVHVTLFRTVNPCKFFSLNFRHGYGSSMYEACQDVGNPIKNAEILGEEAQLIIATSLPWRAKFLDKKNLQTARRS